ncbi:MAG: 30S ribosomal protein S8 [bacterium]|nr:30S ribosomal protein S8 [bacterium]MDD5529781.1 30S ribosomal protein S8 [bacterium]
MGMTDPIGDMLTRIRNAINAKQSEVIMPSSIMKLGVADVLKREGYIKDYNFEASKPKNFIHIYLKNVPVIQEIKRVSKPGCRMYSSAEKLPRVRDGLGIAILSTSRGILSSREAKNLKIGGEVLAYIW